MQLDDIYYSLTMSSGKVLKTNTHAGYHYIIISYGTHPCAYVDLPKKHPWYELKYDEIPVKCHGGLTYSEKNDKFWRIGWDYAHCDDYSPLYFNSPENFKKWTVEEIVKECESVCNQAYRVANEAIEYSCCNEIVKSHK